MLSQPTVPSTRFGPMIDLVAIEAFLAEPQNMMIAGIRRDSRPHLTPNWLLRRDSCFFGSTTKDRAGDHMFSHDHRCNLSPTEHEQSCFEPAKFSSRSSPVRRSPNGCGKGSDMETPSRSPTSGPWLRTETHLMCSVPTRTECHRRSSRRSTVGSDRAGSTAMAQSSRSTILAIGWKLTRLPSDRGAS